MKAIAREPVFNTERKEERVVIIADTTPSVLPTTGANVDDMPDTTYIAAGSVLIALDAGKTYIAGETGEFVEWQG